MFKVNHSPGRAVLAALACVAAAAFAPPAVAQAPDSLTFIGRGAAGAISDLAMSVLEEATKRAYPDVKLRRLPGTATAVPPRIESGEAQFGHGVGESVADAWSGERSFAGKPPMKSLRYVGMYLGYALRPTVAPTLVTLEKSGIKTWGDLKGKRIAVGPPDSLTSKMVNAGLAGAGLSYDKIKEQGGLVVTGDWNQAMDQLGDGQVDAVFVSADHPSAIITRLWASHKVRLVSAPAEVVNALITAYPTSIPDSMEPGVYEGQSYQVSGIKLSLAFVVHKDVPEEVVYNICKQLYFPDKAAVWDDTVPSWKGASKLWKDAASNVFIPIHPGAKRCFEEAKIPIKIIAKGGDPAS